MNKAVIIGIGVALAAIGGALASPLFYDTQVDEALPTALNDMQEGLTLEKFKDMDESDRSVLIESMPKDVKDMIMDESAKIETTVSEEMDDGDDLQVLKTGQFVGLAGHSAMGDAKIIEVDGIKYLRFENFKVTNGPDLRVYVTPDGNVKNGVHLEKLKGSKGAQNYVLEGIDIDKHSTVVIYCQPFGAYFGEAKLG